MFSATFPDDIKRLADQILKDPARLQIARRNTVAGARHAFGIQSRSAAQAGVAVQPDPLPRYQASPRYSPARRSPANRLARQLERDGFNCAAQHSDKSQQERTAALAAFKEGKVQVLVATDVAARGLDIEHLPLVINYELPPNPDDYIHRIGRTGRAGMAGEAISLVAPDEREALASIEKLIKMSIPIQPTPESDFRPPEAHRGVASMGTSAPEIPSRASSRSAQSSLAVSAIESSLAESSSSMDALYVASAERAITPPAANVERRPRQVAALFLPPVTAKQD
jgi:ATP-dependent RNA helicase RhlE